MALYVANKYRCTTAPLLDTPRRIGEESVRTRLVTPVVNKVIRDIKISISSQRLRRCGAGRIRWGVGTAPETKSLISLSAIALARRSKSSSVTGQRFVLSGSSQRLQSQRQ